MEKQKEYLAALAMPPLTARYSDGSTEEIPVVWDEKALSAVRLVVILEKMRSFSPSCGFCSPRRPWRRSPRET